MDTQDREKYRQLRQQQRERQLHIIRLSILLGVGENFKGSVGVNELPSGV